MDDSPSLSKAILPHPIHMLGFFHLEHKNEDLLITDGTHAIDICGSASQEKLMGEIPICYLC
jgi:hypothetical protein